MSLREKEKTVSSLRCRVGALLSIVNAVTMRVRVVSARGEVCSGRVLLHARLEKLRRMRSRRDTTVHVIVDTSQGRQGTWSDCILLTILKVRQAMMRAACMLEMWRDRRRRMGRLAVVRLLLLLPLLRLIGPATVTKRGGIGDHIEEGGCVGTWHRQ